MQSTTRRRGLALAPLALALTLSSCASTDDGKTKEPGNAAEYTTGLVNLPEDGDPVKGGTLTLGAYSEPAVLDPAQAIVAGSTGGVSLTAIFDVLMRWDSKSNDVVPQLAESLEPNEDFTEWTMTLRDDVKFSDGTPFDSAAVKWSIERYVEDGGDEAMLWNNNVEQVATPDDRTVVFELNTTWPTFEYMMTTGPGMVVAKSSDAGGSFKPVGAGAFTLAEHKPAEYISLEANPAYWDGAPNLDGVKEVFLNDPSATLDSFRNGSIDSVFLREPDLVDELVQDEASGFLNMVSLGNVAVINSAKGRPGSDPRVRRAMQLAIDPEVVNNRAYEGAGIASNEIFPDFSIWNSDADALPYDPDQAKQLLEEAKADGYDGKVTHLDASDPASRATALTIKASLEAVGFDVELDLVASVADQVNKVAIEGDYDIAGWGISWREAGTFARMFATLHSDGNLSVGMPTTPEMDALIEEVQAAPDEETEREVKGRIQEQWNEDVPALVFAPTAEFLAWDTNVHGVVDTTNSMVLLDDAWMSKQ
ncbi:MAG: ABC transporter substrate-binding protein [Nocardioides sp.]|nr:ABC transporter substrate-binding protein [Nocardioides sp.]